MEAAASSVAVVVMAKVVFTATSLAEFIHANLPLTTSHIYITFMGLNS
jgi:hypothetical protein